MTARHEIDSAIVDELSAEIEAYRNLAEEPEPDETDEEAEERRELFSGDADDVAELLAKYLLGETEPVAEHYHTLATNTREFLMLRAVRFTAWIETVPLPSWLANA